MDNKSIEYLIDNIRNLICYLNTNDVISLMEAEGFDKDSIYLALKAAEILNKYEFSKG